MTCLPVTSGSKLGRRAEWVVAGEWGRCGVTVGKVRAAARAELGLGRWGLRDLEGRSLDNLAWSGGICPQQDATNFKPDPQTRLEHARTPRDS